MKEVLFSSPDQPCFIGGWYIKDIELCDAIVEAFESDCFPKGSGTVGGGPNKRVAPEIKNSTDGSLYNRCDLADAYKKNLQSVLELYKAKFPYSNDTEPYYLDQLNIQKYEKGNSYAGWHSERTHNSPRHLVYMTYLNDIEEGGETEFFHQKIKIQPSKGLTLIWPVDWTYLHKGCAAPNEEKFIITGWYNFFENVNDWKAEKPLDRNGVVASHEDTFLYKDTDAPSESSTLNSVAT